MSPHSARTVITRHWSGDLEVRAAATPVPGLVVNEDVRQPGHWMVTHEPSGYALADLPDPEGALGAALELGEIADWTRSVLSLLGDGATERAWRDWAAGRCPEIFCRPTGRGRNP